MYPNLRVVAEFQSAQKSDCGKQAPEPKKISKFRLEDALWRMYYALRHTDGASLMAIEFMHNGRLWRADTEDEAIRLRRKLEERDRVAEMQGEESDTIGGDIWTPDAAMELLKHASDHQKHFLKLLYDESSVKSDKAIKKLSLDSEVALAGVLSGLSKNLKKINIKPWHLYVTRVEWDGKVKSRSFELTQDFRATAIEIGWPERWF
jgi:hypothetical protein